MDPQRLLLLSLLLWSHSEAKVVESVSDCEEFFLNGDPPQIPGVLENGQIQDQNRFKAISQNQRTFFTLYDTRHKIPVFSAYIFNGNEPGTRRPSNPVWMTELQIDLQNQGTFNDFKNNSDYDKGHLRASSYACSQADMISTFTLTNVVPQAGTFNKGSWNTMEQNVKRFMENHCINNNNQIEGYVVTGAVPGNNLLNEKINIPSLMWSAFCCYDSTTNTWHAGAHWGDNVHETKGKCMETMTLEELYSKLEEIYSKLNTQTTAFKLFSGNQCPSDVKVELNRKGKDYPKRNAVNIDCNYATSTQSTTTTTTKASKKTTTSKGTENLGNKILNALRNCFGATASGLSGLLMAIASGLSGLFQAIASGLGGVFMAIASGLSGLFMAIASGLSGLFEAIASGLIWLFGTIASGLIWLFGAIASGLFWLFGAIASVLRWILKAIALVLAAIFVCLSVGVLYSSPTEISRPRAEMYSPRMDIYSPHTEICPLHLTHPLRQ